MPKPTEENHSFSSKRGTGLHNGVRVKVQFMNPPHEDYVFAFEDKKKNDSDYQPDFVLLTDLTNVETT